MPRTQLKWGAGRILNQVCFQSPLLFALRAAWAGLLCVPERTALCSLSAALILFRLETEPYLWVPLAVPLLPSNDDLASSDRSFLRGVLIFGWLLEVIASRGVIPLFSFTCPWIEVLFVLRHFQETVTEDPRRMLSLDRKPLSVHLKPGRQCPQLPYW